MILKIEKNNVDLFSFNMFNNCCLFKMVHYILQGEAHSDDGELDDVRMLFSVMHLKKSCSSLYIVNTSTFHLNYEKVHTVYERHIVLLESIQEYKQNQWINIQY